MVDKTILPMKFVKKGWGYELWIVNKKEYCGTLKRASVALGTTTK